MYSYEERKKAVDLYIKYGKKATAVITELGYPNRHSLVQWYKAFTKAGKIEVPDLSGRTKYTEEQKIKAVEFYIEHVPEIRYQQKKLLKNIMLIGQPFISVSVKSNLVNKSNI